MLIQCKTNCVACPSSSTRVYLLSPPSRNLQSKRVTLLGSDWGRLVSLLYTCKHTHTRSWVCIRSTELPCGRLKGRYHRKHFLTCLWVFISIISPHFPDETNSKNSSLRHISLRKLLLLLLFWKNMKTHDDFSHCKYNFITRMWSLSWGRIFFALGSFVYKKTKTSNSPGGSGIIRSQRF